MELTEIHQYWQKMGKECSFVDRVTPTTRDPFLGQLEEDYILRYLEAHETILEVGCGDALHTLKYARCAKHVWALDCADSLIALAKRRARSAGIRNINFVVGSVLEVDQMFRGKAIEGVISQRCLINLPSWEYQREALLQIHKLLVPGGLLLMTEGFQEELDSLNYLRAKVGLPTVKMVEHNRNLFHSEFDAFIRQYFTIEAVHDYGFYLFLSRIYHPLVVFPDQPKHDSRLNEVAQLLSTRVSTMSLRQFSYNLFYLLKKK
jgi:ubiquinone/menaquinone biosynthesis C-methylase UbiE